jgi:hypothetical protein
MIFKNSVRTSKRTTNFTIRKINPLMLFKEINYRLNREAHKTHKYKMQSDLCIQQLVHNYHSAFKG